MKYRGFKLKPSIDRNTPILIPALRRIEANLEDAKAIIDKFLAPSDLIIGNWQAGGRVIGMNKKDFKRAEKRFGRKKVKSDV